MPSWAIGTYWVNLYAGPGPTRAIVGLFEASGGPNFARAFFLESGTIPANSVGGTNIVLYYPFGALDAFMTTLREEKPVYVNVWSPTSVAVSTSQEPIGEDEGP